jgi:hypothetical protein
VELRFRIIDWSASAPGLDSPEKWAGWAAENTPLPVSDAPVAAEAVPPMLRRRLDRMGRAAMQALFAIDAGAEEPLVFASRFGEMARSDALMRQIEQGEVPSPTNFALSVHNALAGQAAIMLKNRVSHSAIAAGEDTLAMGLLETALIAAERPDRRAVLVFYDGVPPSAYDPSEDESAQFAVALRVAVSDGDNDALLLAPVASPDIDADIEASPPRALLRFLAGANEMTAEWRGRNGGWRLTRDR